MRVVTKLRKKIENLEKEKMSLLAEFEKLEKRAKVMAGELEDEVTTLRKEVKSLEEIFNVKKHEIRNSQNEDVS
jgi:predicted  nucleic acid-binding Zn-ribbon protein